MRTRCGATDQPEIKTGLARNSHSAQPRSLFQQLTDLTAYVVAFLRPA